MNPLRSKIPFLPARIEGLADLATNLSWSWNLDARALFRAIDEPLWHLTRHNPIDLLRRVDPGRLAALAQDPGFLSRYDTLVAWMAGEVSLDQTWFHTSQPVENRQTIAYFCAEFGLHNSVPIYSGGLGILAGDHCKAASDLGVPLVGLGLMYTKGYFDQHLGPDGWQEDKDETFDFTSTPLVPVPGPAGEPWLTTIRCFGRQVHVGAWKMMVGRVPLYLLDTDLEQNDPQDRELSTKLYGVGVDLRLKQEWILGVAGVRALRAAGFHPSAWHANEGHAAFMLVERLREYAIQGVSHDEAVKLVRNGSVFTTHTPVPAGHDHFSASEVEACVGPFWDEMGISKERFFQLGQHPVEGPGEFHMTVLAMRLSRGINGVSRVHGAVSRELWRELWPGRSADIVPIGHVTNGVHVGTWMAKPALSLMEQHLGPNWDSRTNEPEFWNRVLQLDDAEFWYIHQRLKYNLMNAMREDARRRFTTEWKEAAHVVGAGTLLDPNALTIGFARRFATYKRADLMFRDADRLRRLLVNPWKPVQIVFAGKAHPADQPGKELLQRVYKFTREPQFEGRVAFIEDYEMHVAHVLVQGVDVWLNLPRVPLEASGTSGMKAALNGVPQISTLDGWWAEGYDGTNGWAIPQTAAEEDPDSADADRFYGLLEEQVIPLYYHRDDRGIPLGWVERMRNAIRVAGSQFSARRMVQDYVQNYYAPAIQGFSAPDDPPPDPAA
ncbi:MAG: alpha-glucan family phosphorylase [Gemmatimonadota bacterium]